MTQTTEAFGGALCKPKRSIYSPFPIYVVEPQSDERGVILQFGHENVALLWVNGTVERELRVEAKPYLETDPKYAEKLLAHERGLEALKELRALAESRRVAVPGGSNGS